MELDLTKESREVECATFWKLNEQVILIRYKDGAHVNLEDANDVIDACLELMEKRKFLALVDLRNMGGTLGKEAGDYLAKNEKFNTYLRAQALVVNNLALQLVARFYIMINKPVAEAKIFSNLEKAMKWLEGKKGLLK